MKELEKTKRVSISAILLILAVIIGVLSFRKPKNVFKKDKLLVLNHIVKMDYILNKTNLDANTLKSAVLIDIRSPYEFNKGHLKNAINIYSPNLLAPKNKKILKSIEKDNKKIILYGANADEASGSWMLLTQLGYKNIQVLCSQISYVNNKLVIKDYPLEKPHLDYAAFMKKASKSSGIKPKKVHKKVVKLVRKKKKVAEGGC